MSEAISTPAQNPEQSEAKTFEAFGLRIHASADITRLDGKCDSSNALTRPALFQWKDLPPEERPASPEAEYYEDDFELSESQLLYRWADLVPAVVIRKIFRKPYIERQAERVRRRLEATPALQATDPLYDEYWTNRLALLADGMTDLQLQRLLSGQEVATRRVMTPDGIFMEEYFRPMEVDDETKRVRNIEILQRVSNLAKGKATEIVERRNGKRTTADDLRAAVREVMLQNLRDKPQVEMQNVSTPALPEGEHIEAVVIEQSETAGVLR